MSSSELIITYLNHDPSNANLLINTTEDELSINQSWIDTNFLTESFFELTKNTNVLENITLSSDHYFIFDTDDITFDGQGYTVTISNVDNFPGLFKNNTNPVNNITIKNVNIESTGTTTLAANAGWLCQQNFAKGASNNNVESCNVEGNLTNQFCGGIFGQSSGSISGSASVTNCTFTGDITNKYSGGIFGYNAGNTGSADASNCHVIGNLVGDYNGGIFGKQSGGGANGSATATNCTFTGNTVNTSSCGIFADQAGYDGGSATATNCDVNGNLSGQYSIGIFGQQSGSKGGSASATNCTFTGSTDGNYSGGIFGQSSGSIGGSASATNCSVNGDISGNYSGGIFGQSSGSSSGSASATNCYVTGSINGNYSSGIFGQKAGNQGGSADASNCHVISDLNSSSSSGIFGYQSGYGGNGSATATNCSLTGNIIGNSSSGIFNNQCGMSSGLVTATNCYVIGDLIGIQASGIFGYEAGKSYGSVTAENCYVIGDLIGSQACGIFGKKAGSSQDAKAKAINCYMKGNVNSNSQYGIFGSESGYSGGSATATNCYVVGTLTTSTLNNEGIFGSGSENTETTNCAHGVEWNDGTASSTLINGSIYTPSNYIDGEEIDGIAINQDNNNLIYIDYTNASSVPYKLYWESPITMEFISEVNVDISVLADINLIGSSVEGTIEGNNIEFVYGFNSTTQQYVEVNVVNGEYTLERNKAYMIKTTSAISLKFKYTEIIPTSTTLNILPGWNFIGNSMTSVSLTSNLQSGTYIYKYNTLTHSYLEHSSNTLETNKGYVLYSSDAQEITISVSQVNLVNNI